MQSICKEGHAVIQTKTDLQRFLSLEKTAYLYGDRRDTFIAYLTNDPRVQIWRYQKRLRICEYRYNNRHKTPLHFLAFLLARRKKNYLGSRLGIEISENVFDEGLRIYHYGNIVVNGDSRIGKNCVLHGANCIGNAATDFTAPQLGDNIDIGVGASVIGNVTIADGTRIGAGAVVTRSVLEKNHHCWHTSQDATLSHIGEHMTFTKVSALTPHKRMLVCALANACIAVMAVLLLDVFSPLYPANLRLMPDQDFFQLVGRVWAEGGVPYRDIWDQKGPFIFFVNMLGWKLTGNGYGIVIIECVFILATMWLLWLIIGTVNGHEHHPDNRKPIYSYIISMLVLWIYVLWIAICLPGSWNMTELFCLPFLAASAWLLLRSLFAYQGHPTGQGAWRVPSSWAYVHGLAFGVCFMTRLSNAVGVCVGLLVLTALLIIRRLWSNLGICILGFLSGVATFFIPFAVYFAAHDVFYEFMYGTILYNLHYAGGLAAAGIPNLSTLVLVFAVPFAMLLAGIIRLIRHASITCYSIFLVLCAMMFAALFFKMFTIQTGSYLHYTVIDVVFLPSVLVPAAAFLRNKVSRIVALVCVTAALLGYAGMRTYQVTTWSEFDNTWVAQLVKQSHGSIAFYNMNAMAYTLNDVKPAYPYAVFQDWQAEFSDDLRATIIDSYARPRTEMLVVQQYGTLTPIIADILDTKYQFVRSVTDASGTYDIYRCRYSV